MAVTLKEHGIYRRRDGRIVGPLRYTNGSDMVSRDHYPFASEASFWTDDGLYLAGARGPLDLIEEIVVGGEGWLPWNGGEQPVEGDVVVDVIPLYRGSAGLRDAAKNWKWNAKSNPILAYRVVEEAKAKLAPSHPSHDMWAHDIMVHGADVSATASPNMDGLFAPLRDRIRVLERQNADLQAANNRLLDRARSAEAATAEALSRLSDANGVLGKLRDAVSDLLGAQET